MTTEKRPSRSKRAVRVVLYMDRGLAAWLRAYAKAGSLWGDRNATIIGFTRCQLDDAVKHDHVMLACYPHLPKDIREACRSWRAAALEREAARKSATR